MRLLIAVFWLSLKKGQTIKKLHECERGKYGGEHTLKFEWKISSESNWHRVIQVWNKAVSLRKYNESIHLNRWNENITFGNR